jgi:hypothetical protein
VNGHVIVPLADGRRLAVLSVTDHSYFPSHGLYNDGGRAHHASSGGREQPGEGFMGTPYRQAVSAEIHTLDQLEGGPPEVVVCIVNGIDLERDGGGAGASWSAEDAVVRFAQEMFGVDIFIVTGVHGLATPSQQV